MSYKSKYKPTLKYKLDLARILYSTSFKLRYNGSILGFIWVLLKPLLTFIVLLVVFSYFARGSMENFSQNLLLGILLYNFFSECLISGMHVITDRSHVILKVRFPQEVAVVSSLILPVVNLLINMGIFLIYAKVVGIHPNLVSVLYFILVLVVLWLGMLSVSFVPSILYVKFRDLEHISQLVIQLLFYATPIFYPLSILPGFAQKIEDLNPLYHFIDAARRALIGGEISHQRAILISSLLVLFLLYISFRIFSRNIKKIAEFL